MTGVVGVLPKSRAKDPLKVLKVRSNSEILPVVYEPWRMGRDNRERKDDVLDVEELEKCRDKI